MTAVDAVFRYSAQPGPAEWRALDRVREVYGIRRLRLDEKEKTVRVEYDASRLNEAVVASLLRHAGLDVQERLSQV